ncbi:C-type lectin domain-containing protein [Polyangium aurulentum]|uniref:C-type lectin domain-containing protein n=1 Tax=Polyangium aurulentum TaxID=2567896 RepID=UPI0010AED72B|nr:C-type lectin domain-containing protein [Polyangium aurulentum]UQA62895.1 C-type lectin domain-containing protein [Polyangium aurulentum]
MNAARKLWGRTAAAAALLLVLGGCNQIAGIEEGELALCDDGQAMEDGSCPDVEDSGTNGAVGNGSGGGDECPASWTAAGGRCYLQEISLREWESARQRCVDLGGDLATIRSPEELAEVGAITTRDVWIGGSDRDAEGTLTWSNGEPWDYQTWSGEASSIGQSSKRDCVSLDFAEGGLPAFNMRFCVEKLGLLCERSP